MSSLSTKSNFFQNTQRQDISRKPYCKEQLLILKLQLNQTASEPTEQQVHTPKWFDAG
jgi:hypothetical protein